MKNCENLERMAKDMAYTICSMALKPVSCDECAGRFGGCFTIPKMKTLIENGYGKMQEASDANEKNESKNCTIIYQVHECYGEWEDAVDHIVISFFDWEKAQKKLEELVAEEQAEYEKAKKCWSCPYSGASNFSAKSEAKAKEYCEDFALGIGEYDDEPYCKNYHEKLDKSNFYIEEVEVF